MGHTVQVKAVFNIVCRNGLLVKFSNLVPYPLLSPLSGDHLKDPQPIPIYFFISPFSDHVSKMIFRCLNNYSIETKTLNLLLYKYPYIFI